MEEKEEAINKREGMIICIICLIATLLVSTLSMAKMLITISNEYKELSLKTNNATTGIIDDEIESQCENKILIVVFTTTETNNVTDSTMVKNALANGGMIKLNNSSEDIDSAFGASYKKYGAKNVDNEFYSKGALVNYISSLGWNLIQVSSSDNRKTYYFSK